MKKLFAIAAVAAMFVACAGKTTSENACCADSTKCCADTAKCCADSAAADSTVADSTVVAE